MSEPTSYDLVQDDRILAVEDILSNAAEPPSGAEFSYPVVGQAVSSSMWQWVTKGVGNGIIDLGDGPYTLTGLSNATNTGVLKPGTGGTANAIVEGFYHQLSEDMTVSLPMPSSGTTTYSVCLTHDPRNNDSAGGPISVQVYSGTPPTTFGRVHVVLWTVRRSANQLLTDATVERFRPRVAPAIYVWDEAHKPDPAQQLWGALCVVGSTGSIYRATTASEAGGDSDTRAWVPLTDVFLRGDNAAYEYVGHGAKIGSTRIGQMVVMEGRVRRAGGAIFSGSTQNGYLVHILPPRHRPPTERRFIAAGSGLTHNRHVVVSVYPDGEVRVFPDRDTSWVSIDGCVFTVGR